MNKYKKIIENWFLHFHFIVKTNRLNTKPITGTITTIDGCINGMIQDLLKEFRSKP